MHANECSRRRSKTDLRKPSMSCAITQRYDTDPPHARTACPAPSPALTAFRPQQHSTGIMEERLDDAIDILKEHAEGQLYPGNPLNHNHVVSSVSSVRRAVLTVVPSQPSPASSDAKVPAPHLLPSAQKEAAKKGKKVAEKAMAAGKGQPGKRRGRCVRDSGEKVSESFALFRARAEEEDDFNSRSSSGNEDDPPEVKQEKEKERRQANNARERYVIVKRFSSCEND